MQWDEKRSPYELCRELAALGFRLHEESKKSAEMTRRLAEYDAATEAAQRLAAEKSLESRHAELEALAAHKDERVDSLRKQKFDLETERQQLVARVTALACEQKANHDALADLAQVKTYIDELARVSVYTRTRFDYERRISRLSEEQKRTVAQIRLDADFLVKGAAGTGKTLVLLKALERSLAKEFAPPGIRAEDLAHEAEDFVWANLGSRTESSAKRSPFPPEIAR